MGKWFPILIICITIVWSDADARSYRSVAGAREAEETEPAPGAPPPAPASGVPAIPPSPPAQAGGATTPATPGASESQIFVWKEGNVLRATNNLSDVPPRYSKRVESADGNPKVIRMVAEKEKPLHTKPVKKARKKPSRRHGHKPGR
ncbi:hypothetical protein [Geomobilimonas luticola]|uniref:DUF4124 domain-containing protein n=1 Tax=Geomobilimonas luticola TaxID=1114878 RepID=A0ABS5SFU7_9BACT|nr:hypothetical protein [Geomobilimonas luticola]MBT0653537.1 hypothetical protein [Geomobilimonas luticola]